MSSKIEQWQFKIKCDKLTGLFPGSSKYNDDQIKHLYEDIGFKILTEEQIDDCCKRMVASCKMLPSIADWKAQADSLLKDANRDKFKERQRTANQRGQKCRYCNYLGLVRARDTKNPYEAFFRCSKCDAAEQMQRSNKIPLWKDEYKKRFAVFYYWKEAQ